jgi:hypothetical protein
MTSLQNLNPVAISSAFEDIDPSQIDPLCNLRVNDVMDEDFSSTNLILSYAMNMIKNQQQDKIVMPKNLKSALSCLQCNCWMERLQAEFEAMLKYGTVAPINNIARAALEKGKIKVHGTCVVLTINVFPVVFGVPLKSQWKDYEIILVIAWKDHAFVLDVGGRGAHSSFPGVCKRFFSLSRRVVGERDSRGWLGNDNNVYDNIYDWDDNNNNDKDNDGDKDEKEKGKLLGGWEKVQE